MTMPEYMNKEVFLSSMGLTGDETKYGNRDGEHQHRSYSTYMSYAIMDSVDDSIVEEELAPVRHGRWEPHFGLDGKKSEYWMCSDCVRLERCKTKYCPNCGAKMDGGEKYG